MAISDSDALGVWQRFEAAHPEHARLIQLAWLYAGPLHRLDDASGQIGPLAIGHLSVRGVPFYPELVALIFQGGKLGEQFGHDFYAAISEAADIGSFEPIYIALGRDLYLRGGDGPNYTPPPLDGLIRQLLESMAREERRGH